MKQSTINQCTKPNERLRTKRWAIAQLFSLSTLLLLTMLMPLNVFAQSEYDTSVTFTALSGSNGYNSNENYDKLFDGKKTSADGTKWCCSFSNPRYVIFEASKAGQPVGYTITTGNDNSQNRGRNPLSWKLYGNNEGESGEWTLIQEVTNDTQLQDENYTSYDYTITGVDAFYKYFKWEISAVHSGGTLQVGEFELKLVPCSHTNDDGSSALTEVSKTAATCTRPAYTTYTCSICQLNVEVEEGGDLAPHTLTHHDAKEATCTETGSIEYWQCSVCNKMFSDSNAETEVTDITVAAKGHSYDENFVCTICNYEDKRFGMIELCDGVKITSFEDNEYPWQLIDLSADGMADFGLELPSDCKGIMSSNYNVGKSSSKFTINFKVDKVVKLTFDYAVSSESGYDQLYVYLDDEYNDGYSGVEKYSGSIFLSLGEHRVRFAYEKDNSINEGADRALVYNIKTTQQFEAYGSVTNGDTQTFRKFSGSENLSNVTMLDDINTFKSLVSNYTANIVFEPSFKGYEINSLYKLFSGKTRLKTITGLGNLNTSKVTDMSYMFHGCWSLGEFDLNNSYRFYFHESFVDIRIHSLQLT